MTLQFKSLTSQFPLPSATGWFSVAGHLLSAVVVCFMQFLRQLELGFHLLCRSVKLLSCWAVSCHMPVPPMSASYASAPHRAVKWAGAAFYNKWLKIVTATGGLHWDALSARPLARR